MITSNKPKPIITTLAVLSLGLAGPLAHRVIAGEKSPDTEKATATETVKIIQPGMPSVLNWGSATPPVAIHAIHVLGEAMAAAVVEAHPFRSIGQLTGLAPQSGNPPSLASEFPTAAASS